MLILGIDTSAAPCCAAIYDSDKDVVLAQTVINNKLTHSVTLMPVVEGVINKSGIPLSDIDLYAVTVGPGSFTGLRIGISAVKGMAFANEKSCVAVTSSEAMAHNLAVCDCIVCSCIDARCAQVFDAIFRIEKGIVTRLTEESCHKAEELAKLLTAYEGEDIILVGDGAQLVLEQCRQAGVKNVRLAPAHLRYQTGQGVCLAAIDKPRIKAEALMPMYLKLPQAERELMAKQGIKTE
ncbi:MAG: tRNA (adenosine(37)-N6)-threonylcarbamoyltransferase complex dimerization subunit type 1 TsaB [Ruminiclostridium sp.]|nr:tRNA (adenosine(37)-N6)-threonylcarbamoyltransferase complex dimerization subunit type 1 TsaB [Ruminiclostridium sp.]